MKSQPIKTLVFGGTFDPPHRGHQQILGMLKDAYPNADILVVPSFEPPMSSGKVKQVISSFSDRYEMSKLAFIKTKMAKNILDIEKHLPTPSYTFNLLEALVKKAVAQPLGFVIGLDQWLKFHQWHFAKEILNLSSILVINRSFGASKAELEEPLKQLDIPFSQTSPHIFQCLNSSNSVTFLQGTVHPASSSELRSEFSRNELIHSDWLDDSVLDYIDSKKPYSKEISS